MDVIDHNGTNITTIQNNGEGFKIPDDIYDIMRKEAEKARTNGDMERWRDIHIRLADDDISPKEVGTVKT